MPETTRDTSLEALRTLLAQAKPEQIRRLLADIRLSQFSGVVE